MHRNPSQINVSLSKNKSESKLSSLSSNQRTSQRKCLNDSPTKSYQKEKREKQREKEIRDCVALTNDDPSKLQVGEIQEKERNEGNCQNFPTQADKHCVPLTKENLYDSPREDYTSLFCVTTPGLQGGQMSNDLPAIQIVAIHLHPIGDSVLGPIKRTQLRVSG